MKEKYIKWNLKQLEMVSLTIERLFAEKNKVRWSKIPFSAWATSRPIGNMTIKGDIFHVCQKMRQSKAEYSCPPELFNTK
jgi:hypothetical protein